jgi:NAD(P)-dependent dehydrogenase (short-subunit alcohol dehydrogenase family)
VHSAYILWAILPTGTRFCVCSAFKSAKNLESWPVESYFAAALDQEQGFDVDGSEAYEEEKEDDMTEDQTKQQDPVNQYPQPQFPEQEMEWPGLESQMDPRPDYGEDSYRGSGRLTGKAAIITGGDSGIGRAVALAFAREGADVLISYLEAEESDAKETARVVEESGKRAVQVPGDIQDESHCRKIVDQAVREFGQIDVLVNNAAYQMSRGGIQDISAEELDRTFRTNVFAMFYLCKAALPHMQPGASIINTASIEAYQPKPPLLDYSATKGAIVTFSKGLAQEVTPQGIRVNVVAPGPTWTPLIPATFHPHMDVSQFGGSKPMQRPAQPVEVAPAYVFLASQEASYISGEVIGVVGGAPVP